MREIVFFLEELSAREMLKGLLPNIVPSEWTIRYIVFEGKQDLDRQLERRMRGYQNAEARFVVLRDNDSANCVEIKRGLLEKCRASGKLPRTVVRIACQELESWYLADLNAVGLAMALGQLHKYQQKAKYRNPDTLANACQELRKLAPGYEKIAGSRAIGPRLNIGNPRSSSFAVFVDAVRAIVSAP